MSDALRFLLANITLLETSPLQLYYSALLFSPETSIVRKQFEGYYDKWIVEKPKTQKYWNAEIQSFETATHRARQLLFSPDERLLLCCSFEAVQLFTTTGESLLTIRKEEEDLFIGVAFSSDSKLVLAYNRSRQTRIWRVSDLQLTIDFKLHSSTEWGGSFPTEFVGNDTGILTCSKSGFSVSSISTCGDARTIYYGDDMEASCATLSPDRAILAVALKHAIQLWDIHSGQLTSTIGSSHSTINELHFSSDSKLWALYTRDNEQYIASTSYGNSTYNIDAYLCGLSFSATCTNKYYIVVEAESIHVWNIESGDRVDHPVPVKRIAHKVAHASRSSMLALAIASSGVGNTDIYFWKLDTRSKTTLSQDQEVQDAITATGTKPEFWTSYTLPDPSCIAVGEHTGGATVELLSANSQISLDIPNSGPIVALSADRRYFATTDDYRGRHVYLWSIQRKPIILGKPAFDRPHPPYSLTHLFFSPDSTILGVIVHRLHDPNGEQIYPLSGRGCEILLFSVNNLQHIQTIDITRFFDFYCYAVCLSPDNSYVALMGAFVIRVVKINESDGIFSQVSETCTKTQAPLLIKEIERGKSTATDGVIAFSPDGSLLLFIADGVLEVLHVASGACLLHTFRWLLNKACFDALKPAILTNFGMITYIINQKTEDRQLVEDAHDSPLPSDNVSQTELSMSYKWSGWGISEDRCWIMWNGVNWLWLPPDFRTGGESMDARFMATAMEGNNVLFFNRTYGITILKFVDTPELEEYI